MISPPQACYEAVDCSIQMSLAPWQFLCQGKLVGETRHNHIVWANTRNNGATVLYILFNATSSYYYYWQHCFKSSLVLIELQVHIIIPLWVERFWVFPQIRVHVHGHDWNSNKHIFGDIVTIQFDVGSAHTFRSEKYHHRLLIKA